MTNTNNTANGTKFIITDGCGWMVCGTTRRGVTLTANPAQAMTFSTRNAAETFRKFCGTDGLTVAPAV